jgi:hypothetical protein
MHFFFFFFFFFSLSSFLSAMPVMVEGVWSVVRETKVMTPPASSATAAAVSSSSSAAAASSSSAAAASSSSAAAASSASATSKATAQSTGKSSSQAPFVNGQLLTTTWVECVKAAGVGATYVLYVDLLCYLYAALCGKDSDKCNAALGVLFGAGDAVSIDSVDALGVALEPVADHIHSVIASLPPTAEVCIKLIIDGPPLTGKNLKAGTQKARAALLPDLANALRGLVVGKNLNDSETTKLLLQHAAQHLPKNVSNGVGKIAAVLVAQHLANCDSVRVVDISGERASAAPSTSTLNSAKQIVEKVQRVRTRHATQTAEHDDADRWHTLLRHWHMPLAYASGVKVYFFPAFLQIYATGICQWRKIAFLKKI